MCFAVKTFTVKYREADLAKNRMVKGKRREVFNWLRTKTFSIYLLQEVHCTEDTNHVWSAEWGYQTIFST